jgi:Cu-Zn family superoxide dismutase
MLMPTSGNQLTGTGTFTQNGQNVTLVIQVTNCPAGGHASHIHVNKNCGSNGDDAGGHWIPQGEVIPEITCAADGTGSATITPAAGTWTIGSGNGDVTTHALMVHVGNNGNPGGRMACGLINAQ